MATSLLLIVAWNRPDLWDLWRRWFSGVDDVQVILDRRRGARRQRIQAHQQERRQADRRAHSRLEEELHSDGFVLTHR